MTTECQYNVCITREIRFGCFSFDEGTHENNKSRSNSKEYYPYKQDFLHTANIAKRVGSKGGLGGIKPPTLPISMDTSLSSPPFLGPKNTTTKGVVHDGFWVTVLRNVTIWYNLWRFFSYRHGLGMGSFGLHQWACVLGQNFCDCHNM